MTNTTLERNLLNAIKKMNEFHLNRMAVEPSALLEEPVEEIDTLDFTTRCEVFFDGYHDDHFIYSYESRNGLWVINRTVRNPGPEQTPVLQADGSLRYLTAQQVEDRWIIYTAAHLNFLRILGWEQGTDMEYALVMAAGDTRARRWNPMWVSTDNEEVLATLLDQYNRYTSKVWGLKYKRTGRRVEIKLGSLHVEFSSSDNPTLDRHRAVLYLALDVCNELGIFDEF